MRITALKSTGLAALVALGGVALYSADIDAADHAEAPGTQADPAADIADFYSWINADGNAVSIITYNPLIPATAEGGAPVYDDGVVYEFHLDADGDFVADSTVSVRFGEDAADGSWGVQGTFANPLGALVLEGAVGTTITDEIEAGISLWAGMADDPFFMDFTGFQDTLGTGTLAFDATRDFFAGRNVMAIVIETPAPPAAFRTWATTGRE